VSLVSLHSPEEPPLDDSYGYAVLWHSIRARRYVVLRVKACYGALVTLAHTPGTTAQLMYRVEFGELIDLTWSVGFMNMVYRMWVLLLGLGSWDGFAVAVVV
jgi:hypothetical protein